LDQWANMGREIVSPILDGQSDVFLCKMWSFVKLYIFIIWLFFMCLEFLNDELQFIMWLGHS
jgi:hypothetical protein